MKPQLFQAMKVQFYRWITGDFNLAVNFDGYHMTIYSLMRTNADSIELLAR